MKTVLNSAKNKTVRRTNSRRIETSEVYARSVELEEEKGHRKPKGNVKTGMGKKAKWEVGTVAKALDEEHNKRRGVKLSPPATP